MIGKWKYTTDRTRNSLRGKRNPNHAFSLEETRTGKW